MTFTSSGTDPLLTPSPSRARARPPRPYRPRAVRSAGIRPARSLGQHFLTDRGAVNRIVAAVGAGPDDTVIEVGPGMGVLTEPLAASAGLLIAVEIDARLVRHLQARFAGRDGVRVVEADVLAAPPHALLEQAGLPPAAPYAVAGNLPYNAGAAIVRHFLEAAHPPRSMVVMLQREVAESMAAGPGSMSLLGVSVQVYARVRRLFNVPPRAFYPPPRVTSSVVRLDRLERPVVPESERDAFFRVVRAGFSAPRKQLRNTLSQGLDIRAADAAAAITASGIDPTRRPQELSPEDWLRLSRELVGRRGA